MNSNNHKLNKKRVLEKRAMFDYTDKLTDEWIKNDLDRKEEDGFDIEKFEKILVRCYKKGVESVK